MIELKTELEQLPELLGHPNSLSFHSSFSPVYKKLKKWLARFPFSIDHSIFNDLTLLYLLASKKFLDHRNPSHLFRLILSIHNMEKKLLYSVTSLPHLRHLEIRWISTNLMFPFSHKPVLGCLIGFNIMDRYEVFDEENIILALQKHLPLLRLVKESSYFHPLQHKNLKIFYFEIEKKNGTHFTLQEQNILGTNLEEKVKKSIQLLSPTIFMGQNNEEIYKNILVLSQEIQSPQDLPQSYISLDQQSGKEIIFRVHLVLISPHPRFSLKDKFPESLFVSERVVTVRHLENHPIEAHIFRLHLPREPSLLRSDGSLDFYYARQKVVSLMQAAIGKFRDYNGGILLKQQEQLLCFKDNFPEISIHDPELIETFFYSVIPLEKQVLMPLETLSTLFTYFLENRKEKLPKGATYSFKIYPNGKQIFIIIRGDDASLTGTILNTLQEYFLKSKDIAYNVIDTVAGVFFNCVLLQAENDEALAFVQDLQGSLHKWHQKMKEGQVLRIALEYTLVSLDPRIGGEVISGDVLRLLFEGLTRYHPNGSVENAVAESIEISPDQKQYTFKLRSSLWNDGSPVSAYDFEYAWKKILSPDFKTSFAYLFFPIKNAKEAKEGKVPSDEIGIHVLDDKTLKVELVNPAPYFLQLTAHTIYSPVNRAIDQQHPQWPYECEKNYPCNGPFQLKINQPNQGYLLTKNPYYWDSSSITWNQITLTKMTPAQAMQAFQKNEIDWVGNPYGGWHSFYTPKKDDHIVSFVNSMVCWCVFNTAHLPFHSQKLRQAFAHAIHRAQIIADAYLPIKPAYSLLTPHTTDNTKPLFPEYDIEKARKLFNEALQELGLQVEDFPPLSIIFHEKGILKNTALCLKNQFLECFGIECELKPLPWKTVFHEITQGNFQLGLMQWYPWVDDPIYTLNAFKSNDQETNFSKWKNSDFQHLLDLSEQEVQPLKRSAYLNQAEEILSEEIPVIPLFYQPHQALVKKDLHVIYRTNRGPFNIAKSYFKKEN